MANNLKKAVVIYNLKRAVVIFVSLLIIIVLCSYSYLNFDKYDPSIKQFLNGMDKYEGKFSSNKGYIIYKGNETYLNSGNEEILLKYHRNNSTITKERFGYTTVEGYYRKPGYIEVVDYKNINYNFVKYIFSVLGFAIFLFFFLKEWKITKKGFVERNEDDEKREKEDEIREKIEEYRKKKKRE